MFVLLLYIGIISVSVIIMCLCIYVKNKLLRYVFCTVSGLLTVILITSFIIDFFYYIKGGKVSYEYVSLSAPEILGYFTVNDAYWSLGGDFNEYKMVTNRNEEDMEIRVIEVKPDLEDTICAVYYLPISKFAIRINIPQRWKTGKKGSMNIFTQSDVAISVQFLVVRERKVSPICSVPNLFFSHRCHQILLKI